MDRQKRVLIIDDEDECMFALSVKLISEGYSPYGATDGMQALEQLEKHPIDVIVTNLRIPKLGGWDFLAISRSQWPWIPIIVLSESEHGMELDAIEHGAYAWVRKDGHVTILSEMLAVAVRDSVAA
ncbi:hypothetical protein W02_33130 [Nitrospira sp. KM1]|uniref:response regulator n=1 Tax=Nitrospira sp. KM1 TaxID=1936990 RepID=UPI0013A77065|nr:response regulator [Nitrospira sp. KM1]BCA56173.1 hypothetical protein W02_33130 [Nitrospira sp. KM1]